MILPWYELGPERRRRWALGANESQDFWESAPTWRPNVAKVIADSELIVWSDWGLFSVERVAAAVARQVSGAVTLAELAADLAAVAEVPIDTARMHVGVMVLELCSLGAFDSVALPEQPVELNDDRPDQGADAQGSVSVGEHMAIDAESGESIRVTKERGPEGQLITTEFLPDGRRRITTSTEFALDPNAPDTDASRLAKGDRSVAELAPIDSCMGSKLRNFESVPLLSFRGPDKVVRSVRCHSPEVADSLRDRGEHQLVPSAERGPVEAFVVTPMDGVGPLRIYDGKGERRGRPRSFPEAASIVDQILGERSQRDAMAVGEIEANGSLFGLDMQLHEAPDGSSVLMPKDALLGWGVPEQLKQAGWTLTWANASVQEDASVVAPSLFGQPSVARCQPELIVHLGRTPSLLGQLQTLLGGSSGLQPSRQARLEIALSLAGSAAWHTFDGTLLAELCVG